MKRCCTCHLVKPLEEFHLYRASKDGRQHRCKECYREQYRNESSELKQKVERRQVPLKAEKIRLMTDYLIEHPCIDCGEMDLRVLDFDHRDASTKRACIAQMLLGGWKWEALLEEIAKCDVRCANCHRVRTAEQRGWWKHPLQVAMIESDHTAAGPRLTRLFAG